MITYRFAPWMVLFLLCSNFGITQLLAQTKPAGQTSSVSGMGSKEITFEPTKVRLILVIQAEGRDGPTAVKALQQHKEKVREAFKEMKADPESIQFSGQKVSSVVAGAQGAGNISYQQLMRRAAMMNGGAMLGGDEEEESEPLKVHTAKCNVQAEWALPTKNIEALSTLPETLKVQLAQRDLQGKKIKAEFTDDEKISIQDMQKKIAQMGYYSNSAQQQEIQVLFVAAVNEEKEREAMKEAYASALASATDLAAATGMKLGRLINLSRSDTYDSQAQTQYEYDEYGNAVRPMTSKRKKNEITSSNPDSLTKTVTVSASFALE